MEANTQQAVIKGRITATSNKQGKLESNRKSCYLETTDETTLAILEDLGVTEYTSKDGNKFFIIKFSELTTLWINGESQELDTSLKSDNFETEKEIQLAVIKGKGKLNDYVRIYAMNLDDISDLVIKEKTNPFAL